MASPPTPAEFVARFPEFTGAPTDLVQAKIDDAVQRTDAGVWGDLWLQGVVYRTADLLAKSPFGRTMKMVADGRSVYWDDLQTMVRRVAAGQPRVL